MVDALRDLDPHLMLHFMLEKLIRHASLNEDVRLTHTAAGMVSKELSAMTNQPQREEPVLVTYLTRIQGTARPGDCLLNIATNTILAAREQTDTTVSPPQTVVMRVLGSSTQE